MLHTRMRSSESDRFEPLQNTHGHLPIEHHGLIGDCTTAALVARDGAVNWLCVPRFDSHAVFCALLDPVRGGAFKLTPRDALAARQRYVDSTGVLQTEILSRDGLVRLTDACGVRAGADLSEDVEHGRRELLRFVEVLEGRVRLQVEIAPRGGARSVLTSGGFLIRCARQPQTVLQLTCSVNLGSLRDTIEVRAGERVWFSLRWGEHAQHATGLEPPVVLANTLEAWQRWSKTIVYDGPQKALVKRSAITLKLLDYSANGGIIAAPTSSLPEKIGGSVIGITAIRG